MTMEDDLKKEMNELLFKLVDEEKLEVLQPNDVTVKMLAEALGRSERNAMDILDRKVKEGVLIRINRGFDPVTKRRIIIYRAVESA